MAKYVYKNISNTTQTLIGVGIIKAGQKFEVSEKVVNGNFELQSPENDKKTEHKVGVEAKTELPKK